jgi:hypothetical protein
MSSVQLAVPSSVADVTLLLRVLPAPAVVVPVPVVLPA